MSGKHSAQPETRIQLVVRKVFVVVSHKVTHVGALVGLHVGALYVLAFVPLPGMGH
jgi:hypothetical protein